MSSILSSSWILRTSPPASSSSTLSRCGIRACNRVAMCCNGSSDLKFVLHEELYASGIDTTHAREARDGFCSQIKKLSSVERQTSISINRSVDLGMTALLIAAEDDSLVSHSSVPLPVDSFVERLDNLSMGFCSHYSSSFMSSSPECFLENLERYLYVNKGFRRTSASCQHEPRALYLHSVLTHRSGSAAMLSLIYSEMLKMLRLWGLVDFDAEIFFPHDLHSVPRGYQKQKSKESDQKHIITTQALLEEMLGNLKHGFWPFLYDNRSLFLSAAQAANCTDRSNIINQSGFELASAKAAQHRLDRGIPTSIRFGDMRRALSACECLILLETDPKELRDYSILLYHCGIYEQALNYLKLYKSLQESSKDQPSESLSILEEDAVEKLWARLNLIAMEEGWSRPSNARNFLGNTSEPW